MDAFVTCVVRAMGHLFDASQYAKCETLPVVHLMFETRDDRLRFECSLKAGMDPYLAFVAALRLDHEYKLNGIIFKLLVKETA